MAVISLANPKGGVAKTTTCLVSSLELCHAGMSVCIIDGDPEKWITAWSHLPGKPSNLAVVSDVDEMSIVDVIADNDVHFDFVFVDLEGTASLMVSSAISMSDFVIIPCQGGSMDAKGAAKVIQHIRNQSRIVRTDIPFGVLLTRTSAAIEPRALKHVRQQLLESNIPTFKTSLVERTAYRDLFDYGGTLRSLSDKKISNLDKAIYNATAITKELLSALKQHEKGLPNER